MFSHAEKQAGALLIHPPPWPSTAASWNRPMSERFFGDLTSNSPYECPTQHWFIDSDYNGESFFVRQAYFIGQYDPYKSLKTTLKAQIVPEAYNSLNSDTSAPFAKPSTGRIAVKVINHLGYEVI
jgi:hypothetical protein